MNNNNVTLNHEVEELNVPLAFRTAVIMNDTEAIAGYGTLTWIDDVVLNKTDLTQDDVKLIPVYDMLLGITDVLNKYYMFEEQQNYTCSSFAKSVSDRLETLGWKTYQQLVRTIYKHRKGNRHASK